MNKFAECLSRIRNPRQTDYKSEPNRLQIRAKLSNCKSTLNCPLEDRKKRQEFVTEGLSRRFVTEVCHGGLSRRFVTEVCHGLQIRAKLFHLFASLTLFKICLCTFLTSGRLSSVNSLSFKLIFCPILKRS